MAGMASGKAASLGKRQALAREKLKARLEERTELLTQEEAVGLLGKTKSGGLVALKQLEASNKLIRYESNDGVRYPLFQFDVDHATTFPVVASILKIAPQGMSSLELLRFFMMTNDALDDEDNEDTTLAYPVRLINRDDRLLLELFKHFITPISHG